MSSPALPLEPLARAEAIYRLILQPDDPDPGLWDEYLQALSHVAFLDPDPVRALLEKVQQEVSAVSRQAEALEAVASKVGWTEALREQDYALMVRWDRLVTQGEACMTAITRALKRAAVRIT